MGRERVLDEIRDGQRFILVTHENPDGDALGSLVGMHNVLRALGKDSVMFMSADEFPLPYEYRFFDLEGLASVPPPDIDERTAVYLDCGNIDRNPLEIVKRDDTHIVDRGVPVCVGPPREDAAARRATCRRHRRGG